ncbi:MAG: efflux RND transporter periplasmic adaptor subunit [Rhodospirillales bacterium]|nr:efflux RND transporter periplasmic adaptor subunit [Rhodospirillales bacterium]
MRKIVPLFGGVATLVAALLILFPGLSGAAAQTWEAVNPQIAVGKNIRLEVRLVEADGKAIARLVTAKSTRLDMGPDGMATMTSRLKPVATTTSGALAFETDIVMAGRWALTISGTPAGQSTPISGMVIFTATEKRSETEPPADKAAPAERKPAYYRNPMGLPDISPTPKKDWMGMDYIPVYADEANDPPGTVRISLAKVQRAGVRTEEVTRRNLARTVRAVGTIEPDESRLAVVTAKFGGFVEELFVPVTGASVRAGAPLIRVWIESTEILQKQSDLLTALRGGAGRPEDVDRAVRNLRLFGIPDPVINRLRDTREPVRSIVLTAPADGTVMQKPALVGMRFAPGDTLFKTADLSKVWVRAQVAERDLALVRAGQGVRVILKAYDDQPRDGRVAFVYPELDAPTRTAQIRIELDNRDGVLRAGLYADVEIDTRSDTPVIAIPDSAIIDSGRRRVAFVAKDGGVFEPRDLLLGRRGNGFVEVRRGLAEGERIVVTGNFLIDAESNLRAALATFDPPPDAQ